MRIYLSFLVACNMRSISMVETVYTSFKNYGAFFYCFKNSEELTLLQKRMSCIIRHFIHKNISVFSPLNIGQTKAK